MPIETRIRPSMTAKNLIAAVVCLGFGVWGWYDYAVKIPQERADFAAFTEAEKINSEIEAASRTRTLTDEEREKAKEARATLDRFKEAKPSEPASYDDDIQLWVYIVGCGVLSGPYFLYAQWKLTRRRFRLDDDGTLHAPEGTFAADQLADLDMSRWMEKSIATAVTTNGTRIDMDDFLYTGVEDMVATLAARFHPGQWTSDARPIGDPKSRDTKKAAAEAQLAASEQTTPAPSDETRA
ncbi:MAG: hypothetical protein ACK5C3_04365 [bacterium]|jgi:hypothetical protein